MRSVLLGVVAMLVACGDPDATDVRRPDVEGFSNADSGVEPSADVGLVVPDASSPDAGDAPASPDVGLVTPDAGAPDAGATDDQPPSPPQHLRRTALGPTTVSLGWDAATDDFGVVEYRIYRGGTLAGSTSGLAFTVSELQPQTTYTFTVTARDAAGHEGAPSNAVSATTLAATAFALSTVSFSNQEGRGTHPRTLSYGSRVIRVDLSAIRGAQVYRAVFDPHPRSEMLHQGGSRYENERVEIRTGSGEPLPLLPPRYRSFDATAAVRAAVDSGTLELSVTNPAGLAEHGELLTLEVMVDRPAPTALEAVSGVEARFRDGDTMVRFAEIEPPITREAPTCDELNAARSALDRDPLVRYRIYRSTTPLDSPEDLLAARLVDEIPPLTGWDDAFHGLGNCQGTRLVPRYPVDDQVLAAPGTGIYVRRHPAGAGEETAYYYVSRAVDGAEDFSSLTPAGNATGPVTERPGSGMVLERVVETPAEFQYVSGPTLHFFVRWEAPPPSNVPSAPYDYLVAEPAPDQRVSPAPGDLALHCWGGSLTGGYGWWYRAEEGALLVATNQYPYDWWTGYHESLGPLRPFSEGTVQPFNEVRVLSFLHDFVAARYSVDLERVVLSGVSMGGSGTSLWGIRSGHVFSHLISWVGVHVPRETPTFMGSFQDVFGSPDPAPRYSNEALERFGYEVVRPADAVNVWDYWDNDQWLRAHPRTETPWISYANGKNDDGIGWPQAWKMTRALIDTRRPFNFVWGQSGHGQRAALVDGDDRRSRLDFRRDQLLPAFAHASLDDALGASPSEGADSGQLNRFFRWNTETVVDTAARVELSVWLIAAAPSETATVDLTFRRLQQLSPSPGAQCAWENRDGSGTLLQQGTITADSEGLVTVPGLSVRKGANANRVVVTCD